MNLIKALSKLKSQLVDGTENNENAFISKVAKATGWSRTEAKEKMDIAKKQLDIPYKIYYEKKYYKRTRPQQERLANKYLRKQAQIKRILERISKETGQTPEEIQSRINKFNVLDLCPVDISVYNKYGMYEMEDEDVITLLQALSKTDVLTNSLENKLKEIDEGRLSYADITEDLLSYTALLKQTLTKVLRKKLTRKIRSVYPALCEDEVKHEELLVDIELSRNLLHFTIGEYKMYHLFDVDFKGKRDYLNDYDRSQIIRHLNTKELLDLLNNKYALFQKIGPFFKRDVTSILSENDFEAFVAFTTKHPSFVCKPINDALGRGVTLERIDPKADIRKQFDELLKKRKTFLMEERILASPQLSAFNKDSLNTVRLIVYYDGEKVTPVGSFFRTGRPGSFVDNAGAGGVFASVDCKTGTLNSPGADEKGRFYEEHPDSHIHFKGFQIPLWNAALKVSREATIAMGMPCFIGWDLSLNENNEWVIVEGNGFPQFVHQAPLGHGVKPQFMKDMGLA